MGRKRVRVIFSENGCLRISVPSLMPMVISKSPALTPAEHIEFIRTALDGTMEPTIGWCFVPERALAAGDVMLAQKIALETDEAAVLAVTRQFSPRLPSLPRVMRRSY